MGDNVHPIRPPRKPKPPKQEKIYVEPGPGVSIVFGVEPAAVVKFPKPKKT